MFLKSTDTGTGKWLKRPREYDLSDVKISKKLIDHPAIDSDLNKFYGGPDTVATKSAARQPIWKNGEMLSGRGIRC